MEAVIIPTMTTKNAHLIYLVFELHPANDPGPDIHPLIRCFHLHYDAVASCLLERYEDGTDLLI